MRRVSPCRRRSSRCWPRIDRLTADQKAALQVAAVLGREFSLDLAEEVWDGDVPLEARLQELKGLEFLRERHGGPERIFLFTHALTREVAYDRMLEARRRELHGRAGASLSDSHASQRFEHGELLAYHYSRSASPARAIPYLAAAGARAKDRYANEEAIRLYRKALSIIGDLPAGSDRDRQELENLEAIAAPLNARHGYASPELQQALERTVALAESLAARTRWSPAWSRCGRRGSSRDAPATPTRQPVARWALLTPAPS
jgi:predicted ATPase